MLQVDLPLGGVSMSTDGGRWPADPLSLLVVAGLAGLGAVLAHAPGPVIAALAMGTAGLALSGST